mmetsp:Transcript_118524/g.335275  ORF Transcript_118524/g.335275 Transcript_118524/m.335275 type:complete len:244 (-) Transcript_118524:992-1723(-)
MVENELQVLAGQPVLAPKHRDKIDGACLHLSLTLLLSSRSRSGSLGNAIQLTQRELKKKFERGRDHHLLVVAGGRRLRQKRIDRPNRRPFLLDDEEILALHRILPDRVVVVDVHDRNQDVRDKAEKALVQWHRRPPWVWFVLLPWILAHTPAGGAHKELQVMRPRQTLREVWPAVADTRCSFEPRANLAPGKVAFRRLAVEKPAAQDQVLPIVHANRVLARRQVQSHERVRIEKVDHNRIKLR